MTQASERIRVTTSGSVVEIELARPEAINALDLGMILAIDAALDHAEQSSVVRTVLLSGAGPRGFCAGGDVRQLYLDVRAGDLEAPRRYFTAEYALNARIAEFPKPIVALMHGATMGGGVGLAGHSSIRVITDSARVAMPETRIGFTPDVGGSWLLGRAPGRLGERLGLHGQSMGPAEAIAAGFADHYVAEAAFLDLPERIRRASDAGADVRAEIAALSSAAGASDFGLPLEAIDRVYAGATAEDITAALAAVDPAQAAELAALSPTALEVTLRSVRSARALSLRAALAQELRLAEWFFTEREDALEGIRALLVDKDRAPRWPELAREFPI